MIKLGILGAMELEVQALLADMENKKSTVYAGTIFCEGKLSGLEVVVVQCGIGKVNAALCVQILCDRYQVTHLVNTGIAGSLCTKLDIGDLVISADAVYHDFDCCAFGYAMGQVPGMPPVFTADADLIAYASAAANEVNPGHCIVGRIASGDKFVSDQKLKDMIIATTQALCTEMEGAAIAQAAHRNSLPFVILRAISDKADNSAQMDYSTFEKLAAQHCSELTKKLAMRLLDP